MGGVTCYVRDRTQGPACAVACGPATVFRNYFAMVNGKLGQTRSNMIDNLEDLSRQLGNQPEGKYFRIKGGYTLAEDTGLEEMNERLSQLNANEYNALKRLLRVGVQEDTQVTSCDWGQTPMEGADQTVTQVFGSACSVSYSGNEREKWKPFASL